MGGFQLWVNLPAELKMTRPRYQDLGAAEIPEVRRDDGTVIRVVAGEVDGVAGAVTEIYAEPEYLDVALPAGVTSCSRCRAGTRPSPTPSRAKASSAWAATSATAATWTARCCARRSWRSSATATRCAWRRCGGAVRFLLVSGKPLGEPIARYGPFVMNTREELQLALRDLQNDTFVWRDDAEWARTRRTWSPETFSR